jgi:hypothetical protein
MKNAFLCAVVLITLTALSHKANAKYQSCSGILIAEGDEYRLEPGCRFWIMV